MECLISRFYLPNRVGSYLIYGVGSRYLIYGVGSRYLIYGVGSRYLIYGVQCEAKKETFSMSVDAMFLESTYLFDFDPHELKIAILLYKMLNYRLL